MSLRTSARCADLTISPIRRMTLECKKVGGVNLSQGVCDIPVPAEVRDALREVIDGGFDQYTRFDGLESLRTAIATKLAAGGLEVDPEQEVVVTVGATGAFLATVLGLLDPGDEVLLFEPFYGYHRSALRTMGVTPRIVPLAPPSWSLDLDAVAAACGPRTRAMVVNTPANPTGKVFGRDELEGLAALAEEKDLLVFTDEIYEHFLYDGRRHHRMACLPGMRERTITISGFSKTLAITGWRLGYLVADARWTPALRACSDIAYVCAPSILQEAVARGLGRLPAGYYEDLGRAFHEKRARICDALEAAGLAPHVPQGAYYVLADVSRLPGETSQERVMHLLEATGVASVPGSAFFQDPAAGHDLARFCFAKTDEELTRAVEGLARL